MTETDPTSMRGKDLGIWVCTIYTTLWILEGAISKWIIPGTNIFYALRDAVVIAGLLWTVAAYRVSWKPMAALITGAILVITAWTVLQALLGSHPLPVYAVGWRSYVAPLLFLLLATFVGSLAWPIRIARLVLLMIPVELALAAVQAYADVDSFWNTQGGEASRFVSGDLVRASGTFTSPAGFGAYYLFAAALVLGLLVSGHDLGRGTRGAVPWILAVMLVITALLSGARFVVASAVVMVLVSAAAAIVRSRLTIGQLALRTTALAVVALVTVALFIPDVPSMFAERVAGANRVENTEGRITDSLFGFATWPDSTTIGDGAGSHSTAGQQVGSRERWIEIETLKWVAEFGIIGLLAAYLRVPFALWLTFRAVRDERLGAFRIVPAALALQILVWTVTQYPTAQGFVGLTLVVSYMSWPRGPRACRVEDAKVAVSSTGVRNAGSSLRLDVSRPLGPLT